MSTLTAQVAVVAGATRGAGRGIAVALGEAGATVVCSGRSTTGQLAGVRPETIDETAELVNAAGGRGVALRTDHRRDEEVQALFERVGQDYGRLDVLVNDIWGGEELTQWGTPFWELDVAQGFALLDTAVRTHILTSRYGVPLMLPARRGLVVEVTDGDHAGYRGNQFYDLAKNATIRLALGMAEELREHGIAALAVTPGFLRSEAMLDTFGVTAANWQDAAASVQGFEESETPAYVGRAVAALAADPRVLGKSGGVYASWTLAAEYGFTDSDGRQPHWTNYGRRTLTEIVERGGPRDAEERYWLQAWYSQYRDHPDWQELLARIAPFVDPPPNSA